MQSFVKIKNEEKSDKEKFFPEFENLKNADEHLLKLSLTKDNKLLFRYYNIKSLDFKCFEVIKTKEEIFKTYEAFKGLVNEITLYNVLEGNFKRRRIINYDRESDTISIETNINETMLKFVLYKRDITCQKEYIRLLCHTIKQLKENSESIKEKNKDFAPELVEPKKMHSMLNDIEILKSQIEIIKKTLKEKEEEINLLKEKNKELDGKIDKIDKNANKIDKNANEINKLKKENENLQKRIIYYREFNEKINKILEKSKETTKMTIPLFNSKYWTSFDHNKIKNIGLKGFNIGNIGLKDLCELEFYDLEMLNLSSNNLSDITYLGNAKFPKLRELNLFSNKIKDISVLEKVKFPFLTKLVLSYNDITDIKVLKNVYFPSLEKLALSNNRIKDLNVLSEVDFSSLSELKLSGNEISDISFLENKNNCFSKLKVLFLSHNKIKNIDILENAQLKNLEELKLSNNKIQDIKKLENANFKNSLWHINLSNNEIENIDCLHNFPQLKAINIYSNNINMNNIPFKLKNIIKKNSKKKLLKNN